MHEKKKSLFEKLIFYLECIQLHCLSFQIPFKTNSPRFKRNFHVCRFFYYDMNGWRVNPFLPLVY